MMKKLTKKLALIAVAVMAMVMCLVGCGSVQKDVDGDWTVSKINGQDIAEWAASKDMNVAAAASNLTLKDGKATFTSYAASQTMDAEYKSNGVEIKQNGQIQFSILYNKDAQTLTYKITMNGTELDYEMKKGTTDLSNPQLPGQGGEQPAEGGEEQPAEGGEEQPAEGGEEGAEE